MKIFGRLALLVVSAFTLLFLTTTLASAGSVTSANSSITEGSSTAAMQAADISQNCNSNNTVSLWVATTMGPDLWCYDGSGSESGINLLDVTTVTTSGTTMGVLTYNLYNGDCDGAGNGGATLYLTPNINIDFTNNPIRVCSISLS